MTAPGTVLGLLGFAEDSYTVSLILQKSNIWNGVGRAGLARIRCQTIVGVPGGLESQGLLGRADGALPDLEDGSICMDGSKGKRAFLIGGTSV